jgi:hypothetical protein
MADVTILGGVLVLHVIEFFTEISVLSIFLEIDGFQVLTSSPFDRADHQ